MIRALQLWWLGQREIFLEAQVANAQVLLRDHRERMDACQAALSVVQRRLTIARISGEARPLLIEALKRRNAA